MTQQANQTNRASSNAANQSSTPGGVSEAVETGPIEISSQTVEESEEDIDRIDDPSERNGGAFRPFLSVGETEQEVVLTDGGTDYGGDKPQYEVTRPDWESPRMVSADSLTIYTSTEV